MRKKIMISFRRFHSKLKKASSHQNSKPLFKILFEYFFYRILAPEIAEQYFSKYFFLKDVNNYTDYLLSFKLFKKSFQINNPTYFPMLYDKYNFSLFFRERGINTLKTFAFNERALFKIDQAHKIVHNKNEFYDLLYNLKDGEHNLEKLIIKKNRDSWGGKNIFKIDINLDTNLIHTIYSKVIQSSYIVQELIQQHSVMSKINPYSVNTIRLTTYNDLKEVKLLHPLLRTATNRTFIDNISSGGGYVGIDDTTGKLKNKLYTNIDEGTGEIHTKHPLTNLSFEGFQVPYYNEVRELALKAATAVPEIMLVGWDIAIKEDGPVLIEGNHFPDLLILEVLVNGAKNDPVLMDLINKINILK